MRAAVAAAADLSYDMLDNYMSKCTSLANVQQRFRTMAFFLLLLLPQQYICVPRWTPRLRGEGLL